MTITVTFEGNDRNDIENQLLAFLEVEPIKKLAQAIASKLDAPGGNGTERTMPAPLEKGDVVGSTGTGEATAGKKKRKRRTKTEMEAARAAEAMHKSMMEAARAAEAITTPVEEIIANISPAPEEAIPPELDPRLPVKEPAEWATEPELAPEPELPLAPENPLNVPGPIDGMTEEQAHSEAVTLLKEIWAADMEARLLVSNLLQRYNVKVFMEIPMSEGYELLSQTKSIAAEAGIVS